MKGSKRPGTRHVTNILTGYIMLKPE